MRFNIDVCISSSIEYTHISMSIFDKLKYKCSPLFRSEFQFFFVFFFYFSYDGEATPPSGRLGSRLAPTDADGGTSKIES